MSWNPVERDRLLLRHMSVVLVLAQQALSPASERQDVEDESAPLGKLQIGRLTMTGCRRSVETNAKK